MRFEPAPVCYTCNSYLCIETWKHQNVELEHMMCTKCDDHVMEDDVHFLLECKDY